MTLSVEHGSCLSTSLLAAAGPNVLLCTTGADRGSILTFTGEISSGEANGFASGSGDLLRHTVG